MTSVDAATDWLWSLPLIVMSVVIHVVGLMIIFREAVRIMGIAVVRRRFAPMFIVVMGMVALLATVLHGLEGTLWAVSYRLLDAIPDGKVNDALLAQCDDELRTRELVSKGPLAAHGSLRGSERHAAVWAHDCILVRDDPGSLGH
jgi:hypothetical protein